jgi:hypothetical protein
MTCDSRGTRLGFVEREEVPRRVVESKQISRGVGNGRYAIDNFFYAMLQHFFRTYAESIQAIAERAKLWACTFTKYIVDAPPVRCARHVLLNRSLGVATKLKCAHTRRSTTFLTGEISVANRLTLRPANDIAGVRRSIVLIWALTIETRGADKCEICGTHNSAPRH